MKNVRKLNIPGIRSNEYSQSRISVLLDLIPYGTMIFETKNGHVSAANLRAAEITCRSRAELLKQTVFDLIPGWTPKTISQSIGNAIVTISRNNDEPITSKITCLTLDDNNRHQIIILEDQPDEQSFTVSTKLSTKKFLSSLTDLFLISVDGNLSHSLSKALGIIQDITKSNHTLVYLAGSRSPNFQLVAALTDSTWFPRTLSLMDMPIITQPILWRPGNHPNSLLEKLASAQGIEYLSVSPLGEQGSLIGFLVLAGDDSKPIQDLNSYIKLFSSIFSDIISKHALLSSIDDERILRSQIDELKNTAFSAIDEGLIVLTQDLIIQSINNSAEIMLGYQLQEVKGQSIDLIMLESQEITDALLAVKIGRKFEDIGIIRLLRRNGESFPVKIGIYPLSAFHEAGQMLLIIKDLSEYEQMQENVHQLEQQAVLGEISAVFAHEIRNPINNLSTGLEWLAINTQGDDAKKEVLERLQQDCDRLAHLMRSIQTFSRPTEYTIDRLDLYSLLDHLLDHFRPRLARANIQYRLQSETDLPPIMGNSRALEQVFSNLITNASQAMQASGGQLVIKLHRIVEQNGKHMVQVDLVDTGPGIPKEIREKVFQPFFTTHSQGTGLGLAISKNIITAHKGTITLDSFPGGTVFIVRLPALR